MTRRPRPQTQRPPQTRTIDSAPILTPVSLAILGGVFILGIGIGIGFSSVATTGPENVATRAFIDERAPNPDICAQYGASAIVTDARVFVTLNPFNVYITQPKMQPGCVLRSNNWSILEQRNLINSEQVRDCKNRLNTFGWTGQLEASPQISCVYQNDSAQNLFLPPTGSGAAPGESERF